MKATIVTSIPMIILFTAITGIFFSSIAQASAQNATQSETNQTGTNQTNTQDTTTSTPTPVPVGDKQEDCDRDSYPDVCIPPYPPDLNCGDISYKDIRVLPPDPHGLDGNDKDGVGCER
jgi:hypothetical protein